MKFQFSFRGEISSERGGLNERVDACKYVCVCVCVQPWKWFRQNLLLVLTVISVFLGFLIGFVARLFEPSEEVIMFVSFPGDVLMRILKMLILPLIVSSLIAGIYGLHGHAPAYTCIRRV